MNDPQDTMESLRETNEKLTSLLRLMITKRVDLDLIEECSNYIEYNVYVMTINELDESQFKLIKKHVTTNGEFL